MRPIWSHHSDAGPFGAYSVGLRFDAIQPLVKEIELAGSVLIENILDMKIVGGAGDPKLIDHVWFTSDTADNVTGAARQTKR